MSAMSDRPLVSFRHVSKRFPGARALEDVSFDVRRGSCHALCGENGAGKSTLGKLLAGIDQPDSGEIAVDGRVVHFEDPRDALRGRHRDGAPGAGVLREPVGRREPLPRRSAGQRRVRVARRDVQARPRDARRDRRAHRRAPAGRRADRRRAADGADRRRGRQRRARHHLRRADQQPVPARDRALLHAARSAEGARRDLRVRVAPDAGDFSPVRHHHRAARRPPRRHQADRRDRRGGAGAPR